MYLDKRSLILLLNIAVIALSLFFWKYSIAKDNLICITWNIVKICGNQGLLDELAIKKGLVIATDPYLSEIKKTAKNLHMISPDDIAKAYDILPSKHPITVYWRTLINKEREFIRFGLHLDDAILDNFYALYPKFPRLGEDGTLYRVELKENTAILQDKENIRKYCDTYVENITRSIPIAMESKKCFDFIVSGFSNKNNKTIYDLLSSQWINGHYYRSILKRSDYPKSIIINSEYAKDNSPNIDAVGNIYFPESFLESIDNEDLKLVMLHEVSHLRLSSRDLNYVGMVDAGITAADHKITNVHAINSEKKFNPSVKFTGKKSPALEKNNGDQFNQIKRIQNPASNPDIKTHIEKLKESQKKMILGMNEMAKQFSEKSLKESKIHPETTVDLFALSLITEKYQQNKYIELIDRFEDMSKGRIDAAKKVIEYMREGYSPMRMLAIHMKRGMLVNPMPLIPNFSIQDYLALSPIVDEREKVIIGSYSEIVMTIGISKMTKYMRKYKLDDRSPYAIKKSLQDIFPPAFDKMK